MSEILAPKKDSKKSQNVAGLKNVKAALINMKIQDYVGDKDSTWCAF